MNEWIVQGDSAVTLTASFPSQMHHILSFLLLLILSFCILKLPSPHATHTIPSSSPHSTHPIPSSSPHTTHTITSLSPLHSPYSLPLPTPLTPSSLPLPLTSHHTVSSLSPLHHITSQGLRSLWRTQSMRHRNLHG